jgi:hypothetical protein
MSALPVLALLVVLIATALWVLAHPMPQPRPRRAPDLRSYEPTRDKD